jgi:chemotaxis protein CheZ
MSTTLPLSEDSRQQLGAIVRQLHDALDALGYASALRAVSEEIPDARARLAHVGQMTEQAAHKVLSLVDEARPGCAEVAERGLALLAEDAIQTARQGAAPAAGELSGHYQGYARLAVAQARAQQETLNAIMLAQDFQDLSGQVIHKVITVITRTEQQLVDLLRQQLPDPAEASASGTAATAEAEALAGPRPAGQALAQDDVDALLASMGF